MPDIGDAAALDRVMARHRPVAILHFAALTYVGESVSDPAMYYRNNVVGIAVPARSVPGATTSPSRLLSAPAPPTALPERCRSSRDTPQAPINPYGASKLMIERMLRDFAAAYGLR